MKGRSSYIRNLVRGIPIPMLALLAGLFVGLGVWLVIDRVQTKALSEIFDKELENQLHQHARESLIRFGEYRNAITLQVRMLANHKRMAQYLDPLWWGDDDVVLFPKVYVESRPIWMPVAYKWQSDILPSHMILIDTQGRLREIYRFKDKSVPQDLVDDVPLYTAESQRRAVLTTLSGEPYLIVSEPVTDNALYNMGSLVILVPLNSEFLIASQQAVKAEQSIVAVLDPEAQYILSSSDPSLVPSGDALDKVRESYVVTAQSFFDYDDSDLNMLFATLLPRSAFERTGQQVIELQRRQRIYGAGSIIGAFVLFFVMISWYINRLLGRVSKVARRALDIEQHKPMHGNQLLILEDWIREFINMVRKTREEMRERHESEMRETEELRSAIMTTSLDSIITINSQGMIIDYNATAEIKFGYERDEVLGEELSELLIAPRSNEEFQDHLITCLTAEDWESDPTRHELYAIRQDGQEFPVELAIKPVLVDRNLLFTVYIHDIVNRRRQENEIRSLAAFPSESPIPVLRINSQGVVIYANSAATPLLDYWGCRALQTLPVYWKNKLEEVLQNDQNIEMELVIDEKIFSIMFAPIAEFGYVNVYARDITTTRKAEETAKQRQNELVHVARLSTMGEMATGIAHELNQPLSAIVNFANGSLRRLRHDVGSKDDIMDALDQITTQASRAGEIIKRMRGMVTRQQPVREIVDLNALVAEVGSLLTHDIRKKQIAMKFELSPEELFVRVDPVQIEQIVLNLMRNASDALKNRDPQDRRIEVSSGRTGEEMFYVAICDNGSGISEEAMEQLFDPFFTTKQEGMGMGLAISKTIVEDHHGSIYAKSGLGEGTTFVVELPSNTETVKSIAI